MANLAVDLGFAEQQEPYLLESRFFPSKIGGTPAWLDLSKNIPSAKDLACENCSDPCVFLCQVYAPSTKAHAFHRTIFVFICRNEKCCSINQSGNIKVFRNQLPLKNEFYPPTPPDESLKENPIQPLIKLCRVCHSNGPLICSKCKKVSYCSQLHQKLHWKSHKKLCSVADDESSFAELLFPEFEIEIESEETKSDEKVSKSEQKRLQEFEELAQQLDSSKSHEIPEKDFQELSETKEDKTFGRFKKKIAENPSQVLRYKRNSSPLWISSVGMLSDSQVPKCSVCHGRRTFEFQIMPQMLNYLQNYELDWGVIAVYTCESDCEVEGRYVSEFVHKQDVVKGDDDEEVESCDEDFEKMEIAEEKKVSEKLEKKAKNKNLTKNAQKKEGKTFKESENWD